ncbi:hypothetical protein LTR37_020714 [Vermiconidia calcicola]|uniref:Uncharacterized protein n=1 Tax=Vermiconidia calcicola TaxID=1690605 RepID=A0ACC3MAQ8_9PEZI|nr:hypothetical protein LTR37_020714 [Vermiconidia calcicola]
METQIKGLYDIIGRKCAESCRLRREEDVLADGHTVLHYLGSGLDHYAKTLSRPFDFAKVPSIHGSGKSSLREYTIELLKLVTPRIRRGHFELVQSKFISMLASCISLDLRRSRPRKPLSEYRTQYEDAFEAYRKSFLACGYKKDGRECTQAFKDHRKGHRDDRGMIAQGHYIESRRFPRTKTVHPDSLIALVKEEPTISQLDSQKEVKEAHFQQLEDFYKTITDAETIKDVRACAQNWPGPYEIRLKPRDADAQVLAIDGKSKNQEISCILQIEVLRRMEKAIGGRIPIQLFFDLIVGTGSAGALALAISTDRTLDECLEHWKSMERQRLKSYQRYSIVNPLRSFTTPYFYTPLKQAFGEKGKMFGNPRSFRPGLHVALIVKRLPRKTSTLLTNYKRAALTNEIAIERAENDDTEWPLLGAAVATMSGPESKSMKFNGSRYTEHEITNSNPLVYARREAQLLWSGGPVRSLSLGAGMPHGTTETGHPA